MNVHDIVRIIPEHRMLDTTGSAYVVDEARECCMKYHGAIVRIEGINAIEGFADILLCKNIPVRCLEPINKSLKVFAHLGATYRRCFNVHEKITVSKPLIYNIEFNFNVISPLDGFTHGRLIEGSDAILKIAGNWWFMLATASGKEIDYCSK